MPPFRDTDRRIARLAGGQHGVVTRQQLLALGISGSSVKDRLRAGRLHRLHRGVYAVGHDAIGLDGQRLAAVLACGPRAALSHRSAAAAWDLRTPGRGKLDVTVASTAGRSGPKGICLHRSSTLAAEDVVVRGALPLTTPARTLLDLAALLAPAYVESALRRADELDLLVLSEIEAALGRAPGHRGAAKLRRLLAQATRAGLTLTLSELEDHFRALCEAHDLPAPEVNARILGRRRDFAWRPQRLVVETDGYAYHRGRQAFERDRARDQELVASGYRVLRFTHRQVVDDPSRVAAVVRQALQR